MIGLDTSVVVRYLIGLPVNQARRARILVDGPDQLGISIVALVEMSHVLRTQYGVAREAVASQLIDFVTREDVATLELAKPDVLDALVTARALPGSPIPDALIVAASRSAGATPLYSFDQDMARLGDAVIQPDA
jgi:predicted nucleic acid-binding protein